MPNSSTHEDDSTVLYDDVTAYCGDDTPYSVSATPWKEVSGYIVDAESIKNYELNDLVSAVLWEMTSWGYDER